MGKGRNTDGRFTPEHTDAEILAAVRAHEPAATSEVAGELDMTRQGADRRLRLLRDDGQVNSKKIGASLVWFAPAQAAVGDAAGSGHERRETPAEDRQGETDDTDTHQPERTHTPREAPAVAAVVREIAEEILPGSGAKLEARREALHAAVEYLREQGEATPTDFRTDVYPEHTGHYTDGDDPAQSWWKNCVYKGLRELAERTALVEKADTTGEWSWKGG
jgi:hypothetical protein